MSFHTIKLGQNLVISLRGDFDALAVGELRPRFEELVEQRDNDIVVDLSEVDFMDSSGIGALVFMFKRLTSKGRKLAIITGNGQPMQMIEYLRINRTVTTYPDYSTFVAANAQYIESGAEGAA